MARLRRGYAVDSRTYYILGLSFWRSEADELGQVLEAPELFATSGRFDANHHIRYARESTA
jgi:hypothetical protein